MSAKQIIEFLEKEGITLLLEGDDIAINYQHGLTSEDRDFIKLHKPELIEYLQNQPIPLINIYGQRQCLSCNYWAHNRCNLPLHIGKDDWGRLFYYTPNPLLWMRCKHHSGEEKEI